MFSLKGRFLRIVIISLAAALAVAGAAYRFFLEETVSLTIIYSTDIQGRVESMEDVYSGRTPNPIIGGLEYFASFVGKERTLAGKDKHPLIFLDTGNLFFGAPRANLSRGRLMLEIMNKLKLEAMAVSMSDYAFGRENLRELSRSAGFAFLSCNIFAGPGEAGYLKPYLVKDYPGLRVGIIGLTKPVGFKGFFSEDAGEVSIPEPKEQLKKYAGLLRKEGIDLIIVLSNLGIEADTRLADEVEGLDIIIGGGDKDGHREYFRSFRSKTIIADSFQKSAVGYALDIVLDKNKKIKKCRSRYTDIYTDKLKADPEIIAVIEKYKENFQNVIGYSAAELSLEKAKSSSLGNLSADALRLKTKADIALVAGLRRGIKPGKITVRDLNEVFPPINRIDVMGFDAAVLKMKGEEIKDLLELGVSYGLAKGEGLLQVSGLSYIYDLRRKSWDRIVRISALDGELDLGKSYQVAVNSYLAAGFSGYYHIRDIKDRYDTGLLESDILAEYIRSNSPLEISLVEERIKEER